VSLAYFAQHDDLQFHPFSCKWNNFILFYGWIILCSLSIITCWLARLIP
jgi:hypothetical protein